MWVIYSWRVIAAWLECFPEKPGWCRNEQLCQGRQQLWRALSGPTDWILRYIKTTFTFTCEHTQTHKHTHTNALYFLNCHFRILFYAISGLCQIRKIFLDQLNGNGTTNVTMDKENSPIQLTIDNYNIGTIYWSYESKYRVQSYNVTTILYFPWRETVIIISVFVFIVLFFDCRSTV